MECKMCGVEHPERPARLCDRCWRMWTAIEHNPELALKILSQIKGQAPVVFDPTPGASRLMMGDFILAEWIVPPPSRNAALARMALAVDAALEVEASNTGAFPKLTVAVKDMKPM